MATASDEIKIHILTETKQAVRGLKDFASGVGSAIASVKLIVNTLSEFTDAFYESEKSTAKLDAVLKSTGGTAGYTTKQLQEMAEEMQRTTTFEDDLVINAQAVMATFTKIGKDVFPDAIKAAADMSTIMGQDLQSSVVQLGKALNDPIAGVGALRKVGVQLTDQQEEQIKVMVEANDVLGAQKVILSELTTEFGGAAEAMGKTMYGQTIILKNAMGSLKEEIGSIIALNFSGVVSELAGEIQLLLMNKRIKSMTENTQRESLDKVTLELKAAQQYLKQYMEFQKSMGRGEAQLESMKIVVDTRAKINSLMREQASLALQIGGAEKDITKEINTQASIEDDKAKKIKAYYDYLDQLSRRQQDATKAMLAYQEDALYDEQDRVILTEKQTDEMLRRINYFKDELDAWEERERFELASINATENIAEEMSSIVYYAEELDNLYAKMDEETAGINSTATETANTFEGIVYYADELANLYAKMDEESSGINATTKQIAKAYNECVGPVTEIADLWGDASQYTQKAAKANGDIWKFADEYVAQFKKAADKSKQLQEALGKVPGILDAVSKAISGDVMGGVIDLIGMMGPKGQLVAGIIKASMALLSELSPAFASAVDGMKEGVHDLWAEITGGLSSHEEEVLATMREQGEGFVDALTEGIISGDWESVEKALDAQISQIMLKAVVEASALQALGTKLAQAIAAYLEGGSWDAVLSAREDLTTAAELAADLFERLSGGGGGLESPPGGMQTMARGGIVTGPTRALIGEAGPEAVIPLSGGGGIGNTYHIYGSLITERDLDSRIYAAVGRKAGGY